VAVWLGKNGKQEQEYCTDGNRKECPYDCDSGMECC